MNLRDFVIRLLINAIVIAVTAMLLPGITVENGIIPILIIALIFGLVNSFLKPILMALSCPFVLLTLGLFVFVVNGFVLQLTAWFANDLMVVDGLGWAILGGIIMGFVNMGLEAVTGFDADGDGKVRGKRG